jgi:hypothetical protein
MAEAYFPTRATALAPARTAGSAAGRLSLLLLALCAAFAVYRQSPPAAVTAAAPAADFSSARALEHLRAISREPHPIGSAGHAAARAYVLRALAEQGLAPEVQKTSVAYPAGPNLVRGGTVENVVARLKGAGGGKAVLLAAHYDTVANSPGAGDNGSSVAALLETARALKAGTPPRNDVILLFTDGEEVGLLGARAFVAEHPWAQEVGVALNFDARGDAGPVVMFETSEGNGGLIRELARFAPHPRASSLAYDIYRLLPNDTDMTVFKRASLPGLNFAHLEGSTSYHARTDDLEHTDERSLQHKGSYALALARGFGGAQPAAAKEGNAVYFDVLGATLVHYPAAWVMPLTALLVLLAAAVFALGLRRARLTPAGVAGGFGGLVLSVVAAWGGVTLTWWLIRAVQGWLGRSTQDDYYQGTLYFAGFVALAVALTTMIYGRLRRRIGLENLMAGAILCWLVLLVAASLFVPGGSYLLAWPLLFSLAGLCLTFFTQPRPTPAAWWLAALSLCAIPAVVLHAPMIQQVFAALGLNQAGVPAAMVALLCGLLISQFASAFAARGWLAPVGAGLVGAGLIAAALLTSGFDGRRPQSDNLFYVLNADTGRAAWASVTAPADSEAKVLAAVVNGKRFEVSPAPGPWGLEYWAPGGEGVGLTLEVTPAQPLKLRVVEQGYGLPELPGASIRPRPAGLMPAPFSNSDTTLISKSYQF